MENRTAAPRRLAVDRIPDDRPAHGGAVNAQLMGTPGQRLEREPSQPRGASHDLPARHRRNAMLIGLHPPSPNVVESTERQIDGALIRLRCSLDDGPIGLADLAVLK